MKKTFFCKPLMPVIGSQYYYAPIRWIFDEWVYCFIPVCLLYTCLSVCFIQPCPINNYSLVWPSPFKLHTDIGHREWMLPIDFGVSQIKVKIIVTVTMQHGGGGAWPVLQTVSCFLSVGINSEENSMSETWENMSENMMDESEDYTEEMLDDSFEEEIRSEEHKCEICQQIFISTESLNNHVKLTHTSVEEFKCDECDSIFLSEAHLIQHRKVHISKGNYKCEDCGASFRFKVSLHIHMRRHNNDYKKHECSLCNKYFLSKESLKKHMSDHLKMTVYQCDECGEEFDQKAEFTSHMLTHSDKDSSPNAKPVCKTCFKSFSSNSSLRKHEFIHLDVKPHRCEICNVSFAQKVQLKLHNKRHNDGLLEPSTPPHLPEPSAPVQELAPASAPAPSPKKATKQTKKDPKDSPTKFQKPEVVPERRNAPRKARNALREQREEENGDKQSAKDTRRRNTPRKARNVIKEEEEEEEEEDSEEDSSDSDDSSSDSDSSDDESDAYSSEDKQQDKNHEEHDEEGAKPLDKLEGYRYPVCEKCNQTFRKRSSLRRHQKSCRWRLVLSTGKKNSKVVLILWTFSFLLFFFALLAVFRFSLFFG